MNSSRYNLAAVHHGTCNFRKVGLVDLRRRRGWSRPRSVYVPRRAASAIWTASRITGMSARYLAATAARESNFKAAAAARTSTARGMFQFIEQTWLGAFARDGACLDMPDLARQIVRTRDGRFVVRSWRARRRILALRNNPRLASIFAARLAQRNARTLSQHLSRRPTPGELYVAHFLGAREAARMASMTRRYPYLPAYRLFGKAARANKAIFFKRGRPRTLSEVWVELTYRHDNVEFLLS
ncbi:MAG: hypothetical protein AAF346_08685 [Pseudomonadota bacterium]